MLKKWLLAGNMPFSITAMIAAVFGGLGFMLQPPTLPPKIAFAAKSDLVLTTALAMQDTSPSNLDEKIKAPILKVLEQYQQKGYLVIDSSKDERGNMAVLAVPKGAIDITPDLRAAIARAAQVVTTPAPKP